MEKRKCDRIKTPPLAHECCTQSRTAESARDGVKNRAFDPGRSDRADRSRIDCRAARHILGRLQGRHLQARQGRSYSVLPRRVMRQVRSAGHREMAQMPVKAIGRGSPATGLCLHFHFRKPVPAASARRGFLAAIGCKTLSITAILDARSIKAGSRTLVDLLHHVVQHGGCTTPILSIPQVLRRDRMRAHQQF